LRSSTIAYYTTHWEELVRRYESADVSNLHTLLKSSFLPGSRLLELGCGSGRDAAFMLANGFDVIATDGVRQMIDAAAICHPEIAGQLRLICLPKDLMCLPRHFDGIYSIATFMHLPRRAIHEVFLKIFHLVRPCGRIFFSVPLNRNDVQADEFDVKGRRFTVMNREEWFDICRNNGFDIINSTVSRDGLGRDDIAWINCLLERREK